MEAPLLKTLLIAALAFGLLAPARAGACSNGRADEEMVVQIVSIVGTRTVDEFFDYLDRFRPAPVSPEDRRKLLEDVPLVTPQTRVADESRVRKLKSRLRPVLALHRRIHVAEILIFRDENPILLTKAGTLFAFSTTFLKLAEKTDSALVGSTAHEIAHEYVAVEMLKAVKGKDAARVRQLELFCDAVAVASLVALGVETAGYRNLLIATTNFSPEAARLNNGHGQMPALATRLKLIDGVEARLAQNARVREETARAKP